MEITENTVVFQRHSGPLPSKTASIVGFSRRKKKIIPICWYLWSDRASGGREQENSLLGLFAGGASRLGFGLRLRRRGGKPSPGSLLALGPHPVFGSFRGRKGWRGIRCAFRNPRPPWPFDTNSCETEADPVGKAAHGFEKSLHQSSTRSGIRASNLNYVKLLKKQRSV